MRWVYDRQHDKSEPEKVTRILGVRIFGWTILLRWWKYDLPPPSRAQTDEK